MEASNPSCEATTPHQHHHLLQIGFEPSEERENSSNSGDSLPSSTATTTMAAITSPKRSRRAIRKKVVTVPIKDLDGSRLKRDCSTTTTPPSDSWAWRKYGQKPIKGSPYPRGYYRCSSSKGCPARKQVERSRTDPTTLVITYSYEHNHPWPTSRNNHHHHNHHAAATSSSASTSTTLAAAVTPEVATINAPITDTAPPIEEKKSADQGLDLRDGSLITSNCDEFDWFPGIDTMASSSAISIFGKSEDALIDDAELSEVARFFPIGEEDESLFADLGDLPECSVVFGGAGGGAGGAAVRSGPRELEEAAGQRRCKLKPWWCGTVG